MAVYDWPGNLPPSDTMVPILENYAASPGRSIGGQERMIVTDAGYWRYGFRVDLRTPMQILSWRGILALSEGRVNAIRVPICDGLFDPSAQAGIRSSLIRAMRAGSNGYSDGSLHSDGSGFAMSITLGTVAATRGPGMTSIRVTMAAGLVPQPGHHFSDGDRLYRVKSATLVSGTTYDLGFLPRLRQTIAAGQEVKFDKLHCLMQIADDGFMRTDLRTLRYGEINIEFTEYAA